MREKYSVLESELQKVKDRETELHNSFDELSEVGIHIVFIYDLLQTL